MVAIDEFRSLALSFPGATESPHFKKTSFRINGKIFATLDAPQKSAVIKLTSVDQSAFCAFDTAVIRPVAGVWGRQGWTHVDLTAVRKSTLADALSSAVATITAHRPPKK
ncbi:MAG: MmcQ/YjbR family DNA-binding protein [Bacteroidota bacterium]